MQYQNFEIEFNDPFGGRRRTTVFTRRRTVLDRPQRRRTTVAMDNRANSQPTAVTESPEPTDSDALSDPVENEIDELEEVEEVISSLATITLAVELHQRLNTEITRQLLEHVAELEVHAPSKEPKIMTSARVCPYFVDGYRCGSSLLIHVIILFFRFCGRPKRTSPILGVAQSKVSTIKKLPRAIWLLS